jgi:hypothetical protein
MKVFFAIVLRLVVYAVVCYAGYSFGLSKGGHDQLNRDMEVCQAVQEAQIQHDATVCTEFVEQAKKECGQGL